MSGPGCGRKHLVSAVAVTLLGWGLGLVGCQPPSKAQTAVILSVNWEKVKEVRHANLYPQESRLEVTVVLQTGEEVTEKLPISWEQSSHLKDGAKLLIKSKDKQYFDALVTIVPQ